MKCKKRRKEGEERQKWEFVKVTPFQLLAKLLLLESAGRGALVPHNSSRISESGIWHQEEKIRRDRDLLTNRRRSEHIGRRAAGTTTQHTPPQWYVIHLHSLEREERTPFAAKTYDRPLSPLSLLDLRADCRTEEKTPLYPLPPQSVERAPH